MYRDELERGDTIEVVHDDTTGFPRTYRVHDVDHADLGLAEVVVAECEAGCDRYQLRIVGDTVTLRRRSDDTEIAVDDIRQFDPEDASYGEQ